LNKRLRELVWHRDAGRCWHCGTTDDLVIHHRANRGMGGSKFLDRPSNCILICNRFNFLMESDLPAARLARDRGLKIKKSDSPLHIRLVRFDFTEWLLDDRGQWYFMDEGESF